MDLSAFQFTVLSYNLAGHERDSTVAGELLAAAHMREPLDLIGLQECYDPRSILRAAGLDHEFSTLMGRREIVIRQHCMETLGCRALALAYRTSRWDVLDHGYSDVAEDKVTSLHGRRSVLWARLRDKTLGQTVFFMDYHGPLPVNSGGLCGGYATAFNLLKIAGHYAHRQDAVLLAGDFNADVTSHTVTELSRYFDAVHTDRPSTSLDHFFATCSRVVTVEDLSVNGSDQDALRVALSVQRAGANISAV
jgi:endonuclease/exonuclease/phosphatase family metal-dependent hydrolase